MEEQKTNDGPSREEINAVLVHLMNVARLARLGPSDEELHRYIVSASRVDAIVPLIDPTLWMRGSRKNDCFLKIARALVAFRAALPTREEAEEADRVANAVIPARDESEPLIYPKKADYPEMFPYEVVEVERRPNGEVVHIEVVSRHLNEHDARIRGHALVVSRGRARRTTTYELVTPNGMVKEGETS